jgi:hypothetical protein
VIATFNIKLLDIDKQPFDEDGFIKLRISDNIEWKKMGLKQYANRENSIKRKE